MAEREGFEPPIRLPVRRISSAVLSTTQPPLRNESQGTGGARLCNEGLVRRQEKADQIAGCLLALGHEQHMGRGLLRFRNADLLHQLAPAQDFRVEIALERLRRG